jgi:prolyl 4-hydroxylase
MQLPSHADIARYTTAAAGGDADAARSMARLTWEGYGVVQSYDRALDLLFRAAESGSVPARSELAALTGQWPLTREILLGATQPPETWARLRRSIDVPALLRVPEPRILSASPRIATVEGFAPAAACEWIIEATRSKLVPARVYDADTGGARRAEVRTNREHHYSITDSDMVLALIRSRIARVTGLQVPSMEAAVVLHYTVGQEFMPHYDFLSTSLPGYAKEVAERGQRVLTFLLCLNQDYEGGETDFPALGRRYRGHTGNAIFFWNVEPDGSPDRRTLHAGLPPKQGEKWMLSQWARARPTAI